MTEAEEATDNFRWRAKTSALLCWVASCAQDGQGPLATDADRVVAVAKIRHAVTDWMLQGKLPPELEI